jgi:hypothetical protein
MSAAMSLASPGFSETTLGRATGQAMAPAPRRRRSIVLAGGAIGVAVAIGVAFAALRPSEPTPHAAPGPRTSAPIERAAVAIDAGAPDSAIASAPDSAIVTSPTAAPAAAPTAPSDAAPARREPHRPAKRADPDPFKSAD